MLMLWGQSPAQPKKILVVDDHVPMRKLIAEALGQTSNYQIREARNGQEALDVLKQDSFDLVISDVMMPGMGGLSCSTTFGPYTIDHTRTADRSSGHGSDGIRHEERGGGSPKPLILMN